MCIMPGTVVALHFQAHVIFITNLNEFRKWALLSAFWLHSIVNVLHATEMYT